MADRYIKSGNPLEVVTNYQALSEVIAENMEEVDDSDAYYGDEFIRTIDDFVYYINDEKNKGP